MENALGWNSPHPPIPFTALSPVTTLNWTCHWAFLVSLSPLITLTPLLHPSCFPPCLVFTLSPQHSSSSIGATGATGATEATGAPGATAVCRPGGPQRFRGQVGPISGFLKFIGFPFFPFFFFYYGTIITYNKLKTRCACCRHAAGTLEIQLLV